MADPARPLGNGLLPPHPPVAPRLASAPTGTRAGGDGRSQRAARLSGRAANPAAGAAGAASGTARRSHPSQASRTVALLTSLLATGGVAAALARADRASVPAGAEGAAGATASTSATAATATAATAATAAGYRDGSYTGAAEWTRWGYVQVRVTIKNGEITDIAAVQSPSDDKSTRINATAQPILERQAVAQQNADLDIVSGATYTSRTYSASLQAALDQAALTTAAKAGRS